MGRRRRVHREGEGLGDDGSLAVLQVVRSPSGMSPSVRHVLGGPEGVVIAVGARKFSRRISSRTSTSDLCANYRNRITLLILLVDCR